MLTSAEDVPPGVESMRARAFVAEISRGDVSLPKLSVLQQAAADRTLAIAMATYVRSLAKRYDADRRLPWALSAEQTRLRNQARAEGHPRYALNIASLALGWHEFLAFAAETGAITAEERDGLWSRAWKALIDVGTEQERYGRDAEPARVYLQSLAALIASGRACLADTHGRPPANAERWGWTWDDVGEGTYRTRGDLVGWVDGEDLIPAAGRCLRSRSPVRRQGGHAVREHQQRGTQGAARAGPAGQRHRPWAAHHPQARRRRQPGCPAPGRQDTRRVRRKLVNGVFAENREHREHGNSAGQDRRLSRLTGTRTANSRREPRTSPAHVHGFRRDVRGLLCSADRILGTAQPSGQRLYPAVHDVRDVRGFPADTPSRDSEQDAPTPRSRRAVIALAILLGSRRDLSRIAASATPPEAS